MKVKGSKIVPLSFIAPLLVVTSGVASLSRYFTPEYTNAWPAMFIQSALVYAYYLLPFSMIVVCAMIAGRETQNNGILKMLALPVSGQALSLAKFFVLMFCLLLEMAVFLAVFVIAGTAAASTMGVTEALPILYLLKWCIGLFLTMLPSLAAMWAVTVLFEKPLLSVGLNLLLVIPGILAANTPLWIIYDLREERGKPERRQYHVHDHQRGAGADDAGDCRPCPGAQFFAVMPFSQHSGLAFMEPSELYYGISQTWKEGSV